MVDRCNMKIDKRKSRCITCSHVYVCVFFRRNPVLDGSCSFHRKETHKRLLRREKCFHTVCTHYNIRVKTDG
jgi:hypothetical protein